MIFGRIGGASAANPPSHPGKSNASTSCARRAPLWRGGLESVRILLQMASWLGVIVLPVVIVCSILTNLFFDAAFYHAVQVRYDVQSPAGASTQVLASTNHGLDVPTTAGMTLGQMDRVNQGIIRFFAGSESLPAALSASGADPGVFKEKEILHMNDVRVLVQDIGKAQLVGLALIILVVALAISQWGSGGRKAIARAMTYGSILTLALVILTGIVTYTSFDWLFLTFHEVTFQNNFWELDPATDHLIQMFPFGFWYDAMLTVALRVLIVTLLLGFSGIVLGQFERRRA